ncbi:hypothetical protein predicted by Glimmer/Critica [Streptococcus dysgalactiae subsp. equisimilis AC-2713]|uniref:Phage protein n=1 Tax=Streptococcus dysgalactiae subsp. equisimilis AC-2713 TaxID=759913 RepID=A0AB33R5M3_STREQ|nr:hypothetical protein predicted by Glimmer/Critica [Streptococcus dysgalactiae subsp. equisimilis AC-2713]
MKAKNLITAGLEEYLTLKSLNGVSIRVDGKTKVY